MGEDGIEIRLIADAIGRRCGVPVRSLSRQQAQEHFGPLAAFVGGDTLCTAAATRQRLEWHPRGSGLIADVERADLAAGLPG